MDRKIRLSTTRWCPDCWRAKQFLKRHGLEFEKINIKTAPRAAEFIMGGQRGKAEGAYL